MSIDRLTEALGAATLNSLEGIGSDRATSQTSPRRVGAGQAGGQFADALEAAKAAVVEPQADATRAVDSFAHGFDGKLHEMMLAVDKADISMRLLVNVRNKLVEAYREVMRMGA